MKKYKNYILLISALVVFAITACVSDDTDFSAIIAEREAFEVAAVELDYTDLDEAAEHFDADDNDYVENSSFDRVVSIAF